MISSFAALLGRILDRPARGWRLAAALGIVAAMGLLFYFSVHPPSTGGLLRAPWDKVVHTLYYTGVGGLAWVAAGGRSPLPVFLIVGIAGALDETAQSFNPARDANIADWVADMTGALLAVLIVRLLLRLAARLKARESDMNAPGNPAQA